MASAASAMNEQTVTELWRMYRNGTDYMRSLGLPETVRTNVAFYEGNQWAPATKATANMPRPVVNMVKFVCRNKRARLTLTPVKLVYRCERDPALGDRFSRFADYLMREMRMSELDTRAIKDGLVKGSYCYHFYWDDHPLFGTEEGKLCCELLDPMHVFFANPAEQDEQKQDWILIASRLPLGKVKAMADEGVDGDLIVPDLTEWDAEQADSELCTVLTRYFREGDQVFVERATKYTVLSRACPLAPLAFDGAGEDVSRLRACLYPVVFGSYEEREHSIYGLSEVEGIVPNQRIINQILGLEALAIQNSAWGKYIVTKDALKGQRISNEPGEVLVDYSATGNGIRKLEHASLTGLPVSYVDSLTNLTRSITGSSEIMTGEQLNNLSGTAIAQLQSQANKPIEETRERFWRAKERQGLILIQCCRLYYDRKIWRDEAGAEEVFDSDDYLDLPMSVSVQACVGTGATAAADINLLETLFAKGAIDAYTFVKAYPDEALCDKRAILDLLTPSSVGDTIT